MLGVPRGADAAAVRAAWVRLALQHHPDKASASPAEPDARAAGHGAAFLAVQAAWEQLRGGGDGGGGGGGGGSGGCGLPTEQAGHRTDIIAEEVPLDELRFDTQARLYVHRCRCGGESSLALAQLGSARVHVLGCPDCSLAVHVIVTR